MQHTKMSQMKIFPFVCFLSAIAFLLIHLCQATASELVYRPEKIDNSHFTIMGFTIGEHTLEQIQRKMGPAKIFKDEEGSNLTCYISKLDKTILIFGFHNTQLSKFMLISNEAGFKECDQCTETPTISKELCTESGITLGMSKRQIKKLLGKPIRKSKNKLFYRNLWKIKMTDAEIDRLCRISPAGSADSIREQPYWVAMVFIDADFSRSKLIAIKVAKTVTY